MMKAGGLVKEEEYPYKGVDGTCKAVATNEMAAAVDSYLVVSTEEQQIEANLVKYGPLAGQHRWIYSVFHYGSRHVMDRVSYGWYFGSEFCLS